MDFQLYQSILKFHRRGTFPKDVSFNRQKGTIVNNYAVGFANQN